ncbi:unnamed protein product [Symbiodinium necroappetens]|uniref:Uncharacterized protein n=1 Tax=Symbiodinium necroappetens TaxID=1628268 RepID=A0A812X023_9DINO|nr:unnamed protein product [Symbiodinium necroappetens]
MAGAHKPSLRGALLFVSYFLCSLLLSMLEDSFALHFWKLFRNGAAALGSFLLSFCISWTDRLCLSSRIEMFCTLTCLTFTWLVGLIVGFMMLGHTLLLILAVGPAMGMLARHGFADGMGEATVEVRAARARRRTIFFEGDVSHEPGDACVVSWPGKYATAWDHLVASAPGQTSAAVVFLPEGSKNFGKHSPIPRREGIDGRCWCMPLYGEEKAWGCRWWALWIENVERAVQHRAELQVYFFEGARDKGKVVSFETAGQENLRREALLKKMRDFKSCDHFRRAMEAGLKNLRRKVRYDSSSQYSREKYRLFLRWLPAVDRKFLEDSDGLGNSQKAEVAWLEKKGYQYTAVDISRWLRPVPAKGDPMTNRPHKLGRQMDSE